MKTTSLLLPCALVAGLLCMGEALRAADQPKNCGQRTPDHYWAVWYFSRSLDRRWPRRLAENCKSTGGRSPSPQICAGSHIKDDLHRCGPKLVLGQLELHVRHFHGR